MTWARGISSLILLLAAMVALRTGVARADEPSGSLGAPKAVAHESTSGAHAEGHDGGHGHANTVHGAPPKGLLGPGTEFLYVSPQLFIWTLLMFVPCVFILKKVAWEPLLQSLENREHKIAESLRLAEEAKGDAQRLIAEQDAFKAKAFGSIRETIDQMRGAAEKESERILAEAKAAAAKDLETAKLEIETARVEALGELKASSASLAASMAGKLALRPFDASRFASVIGEIGS